MHKQLSIWWGGRVARFLHLNDYGDMRFSYAPEWFEDADQFAQDISMGAPYLRRRIRQLCKATLAQVGAPDSSLKQRLPSSENFARLADLIADRARRLLIKAG